MDTNALMVMAQLLAHQQAAPAPQPTNVMAIISPGILACLLALAAVIQGVLASRKADEAKTKNEVTEAKSDAAHVKADANSKLVEVIHTEVNSKAAAQVKANEELAAMNKELSSKIAVLEERMRPTVPPAAPLAAAPQLLALPPAPATVTLTEDQFQQLLARAGTPVASVTK
jgi:hypothetical protein